MYNRVYDAGNKVYSFYLHKIDRSKTWINLMTRFFFQIKTIFLKENTVKFGVFSIKLFKEQMDFSARRIPELFRLNIAVSK